jgi:hypothetical protein
LSAACACAAGGDVCAKTEVVAATKAGVAAIWLRRLRRESLSIVFLIIMSASMIEANYRLAMPPK